MGGRKSEAYPCEKKGRGGAEKVLAMLKGRGGGGGGSTQSFGVVFLCASLKF